ncbi:PAS domain-containing protein [Hyalangium rubrum]|uniref:histidine kinase n=1 Tax=Hyalangium rubrum TaxID=3103134 RepID=A0ABU5GXR5_9BACT|nr:PAS domain-containing protein [Hyalangium sp. s54d21]MDY7225975.1 PAS domain-containing protein [Hyalangium sp. s54d21]
MPKPAFTEPLKSLKGARAWEGDEVLRVLREVEHFHPEGSMVLRAVRDADGNIVDFEWIYANPAAERILGWGVGGLLGHFLHEVPPELGLAGQFEAFHQVVETGEACQQVFPHACNGFDGWLQATVAQFRDGVLVRLRDITAARRAETGLRETRDRMVEILEGTPDCFLSVDANWRYTYCNRNALLMKGVSREKLFGRGLWDTCPELRGTLVEREFRRVMAERVSSVFELMLPGTDRWFEMHAYPSGTGIAVFFRDVTDKKRTEQERDGLLEREHSGRLEAEALARQRARELLAAREKLVQSEKLAVAGQLAAGVGHEINNPLSFVMGNIHFALEQVSSLPEAMVRQALGETTEALEEARQGAERIRGIVRDLKTFARGDDAQLRPVDVHAALEFSLSMAMNHIRYRAKVVKCFGKVPTVWGNEAKLGQVFLNLLVNAAQAIPEGDAEQHRIILTTYAQEHRVVVEVTDTGKGMTQEVLARAFEPFFTTKPVGEGTGLGLSICHGIIKALRGDLTAVSTQGKGSTFRVVLPIRGAEAEALLPVMDTPTETLIVQGKRVLVIDDEPGIASVVRRIIGRGNEVVVAHSGREALTVLERDTDFDRIFCDLMMADLTGMDVHSELARKHPECLPRLVFMTGGGFTARARAFLQNFSHPRIDKPFEPELIRRLVAQSPPR